MKDPFEAPVEVQDSPPDSPAPPEEDAAAGAEDYDGDAEAGALPPWRPSSVAAPSASVSAAAARAKGRAHKEQDDDDKEDHMEVDLDKLPSGSSDPVKPVYALP